MVADESLNELRSSMRGSLLLPGQPGYDEARTLHNAMVDKHPAMIARCAGVADVIAAVKFARKHSIHKHSHLGQGNRTQRRGNQLV